MADIVVREAGRPPLHRAPAVAVHGWLAWPVIGAAASLGAGAIHAAAIGVHSEHRQAVIAFTAVAAVQLGVGAAAIARPGRFLTLLAAANVAILGGWVLAKTAGIPYVDGLGDAEPPQLADGLAAGLAVVAALAVAAHLRSFGSPTLVGSPLLAGGSAVLVVALAVPGMLAAGSHTHASEGGHSHGVVPLKPYDPTLPIDLSGMDGVTLQQQAAAENLLSVTITRLPQFSDYKVAESMGFVSLRDGSIGHEHYLNPVNMHDDKILDPDYPESVVYDTSVSPKKLVAAMYMLNPGDTLDDVPELGGKLTQWHIHEACPEDGPKPEGCAEDKGGPGSFVVAALQVPMMHVWIEPHPCGPFAALEGRAAGTIDHGDTRLCDHLHGAT
ncbi:MAG: hypothetical protein ABWZ52_02715 [Acidimicrobiales bacterium]